MWNRCHIKLYPCMSYMYYYYKCQSNILDRKIFLKQDFDRTFCFLKDYCKLEKIVTTDDGRFSVKTLIHVNNFLPLFCRVFPKTKDKQRTKNREKKELKRKTLPPKFSLGTMQWKHRIISILIELICIFVMILVEVSCNYII